VRTLTLGLAFGIGGLIGLIGFAGCAGKGEVVYLDVRTMPTTTKISDQRSSQGDALKVVVEAFEDRRPEKRRVGVRTHLGGGVTNFEVMGGPVGDVVAQVVGGYLRQKGWRVWIRTAGVGTPEEQPDITITGQVLELSANAKSRFGSTAMTVKSNVAVLARNAEDGSTTSMILDGYSTTSVFSFTPRDMQDLVNDTLRDSLHKLTTDTKIERRSLRLK
jgi:hypothetical protein